MVLRTTARHRRARQSGRALAAGRRLGYGTDILPSRENGAVPATPIRTQDPFVEELPRLLAERQMSLRALARELDVEPSHLSRSLRNAEYKTFSPQLIRRIGEVFGLPPGFFPEEREAFVVERIRADPTLRDRLYSRWKD